MNQTQPSLFQSLPKWAWFKLLTGLLLSVGSLSLFGWLVSEIFEQETLQWDQSIYQSLHHADSFQLEVLMLWFTHIGSGLSMIGLSLLVLFWLLRIQPNRKAVSLFLLANLGGILLNLCLKALLQRTRPLIDPEIGAIGYSLPSGHAMGAMIFYGFIGWLLIRSQRHLFTKIGLSFLLILMISLIGLSRIYLNAHYASDVAAGYMAGCFWLTACILALESRPWYQKYFKRPPEEKVPHETTPSSES